MRNYCGSPLIGQGEKAQTAFGLILSARATILEGWNIYIFNYIIHVCVWLPMSCENVQVMMSIRGNQSLTYYFEIGFLSKHRHPCFFFFNLATMQQASEMFLLYPTSNLCFVDEKLN